MTRKRNSNTLPQRLAATATQPKIQQRRDGYVNKIAPKAISRARADIATWKAALRTADNVENPRRSKLINLYKDAMLDALLTSQIEMRVQHVLSTPFAITKNGEADEELTKLVSSAKWARELNRHILESVYYGHTLIEFMTDNFGQLEVELLPRTNVIPELGVLLYKEDDTKGIEYRTMREYGTWILEFGSNDDYGLLNKAIPHALFKRFAQACWSELCEINGIPPRVMQTNTQDPEMLSRAESMMRDMGAAAWYIIDSDEKFEWAKGADTNGDVYKNLIALCNSEESMLISGVVQGQDTVNGNRSKEESSGKLFDKIIQADKAMLQGYWNSSVIPALVRIGVLPEGVEFELQQEEDLEKLWKQTHQALQYFDVETDWIKTKFGIAVTGPRKQAAAPGAELKVDSFFD